MYQKVPTWFDIVELEHRMLRFWEENQVFQKLVEKNKDGEPWSFLDGPITANNPMGVHHAWGRSLKDAYQRYWAMHGRPQRYQNGYDCQGLWIEVEVEKELGFATKKDIETYGIDKFVNKCKERVRKFSDIITAQSIRLGYWMDWTDSYYTMSDENNYTIWQFLRKCHDRGLIYKGHDVMPWCPRCGTGMSQHEMQEGYKEKSHLSVTVRFPIVGRENEAFLVWTTTPWTLTSNVAIAVSPELDYVKVKQGDWTYILVKERAETVLDGQGDWAVLETFPGSDLIGQDLRYEGPFDELPVQAEARRFHKIIEWKEVSAEEGTGIVHIAPGCGAEDFALGKENDLPAIAPIDDAGLFTDGYDWLTGHHASELGERIARNLEEKKILYSQENYLHAYPHCWRCSSELLFRLVDEWFIAMDPWREEIMEIAKQVKWIPSFGLDQELAWLENMSDWMISKKRFWGLALPIWECGDCGHAHVVGGLEELKEKAVEGWEDFEGNSPHRPWVDAVKIRCEKCDSLVSRITDVGNPWLDAGIVPYSTVHYNKDHDYWKRWIPADLVLECFPGQFRNWFYSLLSMSTMMENVVPFKTLVGHALVNDEHGEEMHKSKGNAIWFDDAAEKMGVEVMRWMFLRHDIANNVSFGYGPAKLARGKFFNTFWNCYGFYANYARIIRFEPPAERTPFDQRPELDRWILSKTQVVVRDCRQAFEIYNVRRACLRIEEYVEELSRWYIRLSRRRFWRSEDDADTRLAFETLFDCLHVLVRLAAPMIPMLTEEMYQNVIRGRREGEAESVHLTEYAVEDVAFLDRQLLKDMDAVIRANALAQAAREKAEIKIRQPLSTLTISPRSESEGKAIERLQDILLDNLNVKAIEILEPGADCPVALRVKPNMKTLGPRMGRTAGALFGKINAQTDEIGAQILAGTKEFVFDVEGEQVTIAKSDLLVEQIDPPDLSIARGSGEWVAFDCKLTDELRDEGLMRDFLRQMQVARKDAGLEMEDRIRVDFATASDRFKKVIERFEEFICSELLCLNLAGHETLDEGKVLKIAGEEIAVRIEKAERPS